MSTTIKRKARRNRFVTLDQSIVEDQRLTWAARGLLAYLLSRPDDWKVLVGDLRKRGNLGRDGIYTLLRELKTAGYVQHERHRDAIGRIRGGTYIVSEMPPDGCVPPSGPPHPASPNLAEPDVLLKTDLDLRPTTTTRQTSTKGGCRSSCQKSKQSSAKFCFPDAVPDELRSGAERLLAPLEENDAAHVIDEWAGALKAGVIRTSPLGFLRTLVARYQENDMGRHYADP